MLSVTILQLLPQVPDIVEYIILLALTVVGLAVGISLIFRWIRRYGAYSYATARVGAMKSTLFRKESLTPLIQVEGLPNLMSKFMKSPYSPYLEEVEEVNPPRLEHAFHIHLSDTYGKIVRFAPDEIRGVLQAMSKKFDVWNLKTIFTSKFAGIPPEEIKERILPRGLISQEVYDRAIEAENVADAAAMLEDTEYWPAISEALTESEEVGNPLPLETALEQYYWREVWRRLSTTEAKYAEVVREAIGTEIDIRNIKLALRRLVDEVPPEDTRKYIIPPHFALDSQSVERMMAAENVGGLITSLEGTPYKEALTGALHEYEETGSTFALEKALDEFLMRKIRGLSIQHYIGIGPLLAFLYEKEMEVRNLVTITNGKSEGLEPEELKRKLINP